MRRVPSVVAHQARVLEQPQVPDTAGRLIGRRSAICCTDRPPPLRISRIALRLASPSASSQRLAA